RSGQKQRKTAGKKMEVSIAPKARSDIARILCRGRKRLLACKPRSDGCTCKSSGRVSQLAGTVRLGGDLSTCCLEALRHLSGERSRTTKAEWAAWSKSVDR